MRKQGEKSVNGKREIGWIGEIKSEERRIDRQK